jgi:Tol biopolymer transport system component
MIAEVTSGKVVRVDPNQSYGQQKTEVLDERDPAHALLPNSFASDDRRLAVQLGPVSFGIAIFDVNTRQLNKLTDFGEWPVWLPDDRRILFVARGKEFWTVDSITKQTQKIFSVARDVVGPPRLTPDGHKAFYSRRVTEADVWIATLSDTADTSPAAH